MQRFLCATSRVSLKENRGFVGVGNEVFWPDWTWLVCWFVCLCVCSMGALGVHVVADCVSMQDWGQDLQLDLGLSSLLLPALLDTPFSRADFVVPKNHAMLSIMQTPAPL